MRVGARSSHPSRAGRLSAPGLISRAAPCYPPWISGSGSVRRCRGGSTAQHASGLSDSCLRNGGDTAVYIYSGQDCRVMTRRTVPKRGGCVHVSGSCGGEADGPRRPRWGRCLGQCWAQQPPTKERRVFCTLRAQCMCTSMSSLVQHVRYVCTDHMGSKFEQPTPSLQGASAWDRTRLHGCFIRASEVVTYLYIIPYRAVTIFW